MINPTPNCNYLLDDRIIFGWYPCHPSHPENNIDKILDTGREVFVNLTTMNENCGLYDYVPYVSSKIKNIIFVNYPIEDCDLPTDMVSYKKFINHLSYMISTNHKLYIHCRGGHGRSGMVCACILMHMGMNSTDALRTVSDAHKTRINLPDYPCPQTPEQIDFVINYNINN